MPFFFGYEIRSLDVALHWTIIEMMHVNRSTVDTYLMSRLYQIP